MYSKFYLFLSFLDLILPLLCVILFESCTKFALGSVFSHLDKPVLRHKMLMLLKLNKYLNPRHLPDRAQDSKLITSTL